jgi:hypothetical protein
MKYYIIYLLDGQVIDITLWSGDAAARDERFAMELSRAGDDTRGWGYNSVQKLDQVR